MLFITQVDLWEDSNAPEDCNGEVVALDGSPDDDKWYYACPELIDSICVNEVHCIKDIRTERLSTGNACTTLRSLCSAR